MSRNDVTIIDNSKLVEATFKQQIANALTALGMTAEGHAKDECPVDTGRLRNSISHTEKLDEHTTYIGTNVEYAPKQEFGDYNHKVGNKHFLKNAVTNHNDEYKAIIEAALK